MRKHAAGRRASLLLAVAAQQHGRTHTLAPTANHCLQSVRITPLILLPVVSTHVGFADSAALSFSDNAMVMINQFNGNATQAGIFPQNRDSAAAATSNSSLLSLATPDEGGLDCRTPWPCWCETENAARARFIALRQLSSAALAMPAAIIARLLGRKALVITGTCIFLIGACNGAAVPASSYHLLIISSTFATCCAIAAALGANACGWL